VLIHTAGQAPRATRFLLRRLQPGNWNIPVYIFTDGDLLGNAHRHGHPFPDQPNAAHLRELNTPRCNLGWVWERILSITNFREFRSVTDPGVKRDEAERISLSWWTLFEVDTFAGNVVIDNIRCPDPTPDCIWSVQLAKMAAFGDPEMMTMAMCIPKDRRP